MSEKTDLRKTYKELYGAKAEPSLVRVPELAAYAIDGEGNPDGSERFQACMEALYTAAYTLKFAMKKERGVDWTVLAVEGDWWSPDPSSFSTERREEWLWTLLIVQPPFITETEAMAGIEAARRKKDLPALADLRFERRPAEEAAHILHLGPYSAEPPTIRRLHEFIASRGLRLTGRHREIYLGDPRRSAPEKLKTIIRQPVAR